MATHPSQVWLARVHSIASAGNVTWNEAWRQATDLYRNEYNAMMDAGRPRQVAANVRPSSAATARPGQINRIYEAVGAIQRERKCDWADAFSFAKLTRPDLFSNS